MGQGQTKCLRRGGVNECNNRTPNDRVKTTPGPKFQRGVKHGPNRKHKHDNGVGDKGLEHHSKVGLGLDNDSRRVGLGKKKGRGFTGSCLLLRRVRGGGREVRPKLETGRGVTTLNPKPPSGVHPLNRRTKRRGEVRTGENRRRRHDCRHLE